MEILKSKFYGLNKIENSSESALDISLIVMSYNNDLYIRECLTSIESQKFQKFEVIIVDDGSSDKSKRIISDFIETTKLEAIAILSKVNKGIVKNYNNALSVARGKYFGHIAADDINFSERLLRSYNEIIKKKYSMIISHMNLIDSNGKFIKAGGVPQSSQGLNVIINSMKIKVTSPTMLYDSQLINKFGLLPENIDNEDEVLAFRAAVLNGIFVLSQSLVKYRKHIDSITSKQGRGSFIKYLEWLAEKDLNNQINNKKHWLELINETRPEDFMIYSNLIETHIKNLISDRDEIKKILKCKSVFFKKNKVLWNKRLNRYILSYYINLIRPIYYRVLVIKNNL